MSVQRGEHRSHYVSHVIEETWIIEELYRQTAIGESGASVSSSAVALPGSNARFCQLLPSTKEVLKLELFGKKPSSSVGDNSKSITQWIFSLNFNGGKTGEWKLSMDRKSTAPGEDPVIVQVEIKILNRDGSEFWKDSSGPFWVRKQQVVLPRATPRVTLEYCEYCHLYDKIQCTCSSSTQQVGPSVSKKRTPSSWMTPLTPDSCCSDCCSTCKKKPKTTSSEASPPAVIKSWSIGNALEVHDVLVDGSLTIYIRLQQLERSVQRVRNSVSEMKIQGEKKVIGDLGDLLKSGIEADLEIKVKGDGGVKLFKAHKCILAARSAVLQHMFATDMLERLTGELVVEDISSEAVEIILKYIYCGTVDLDLEMDSKAKLVTELIYAANKWELTELKELVGNQMITCCDSKNALQLLEIAHKHQISAATNDMEKFVEINILDILAAKRQNGMDKKGMESH